MSVCQNCKAPEGQRVFRHQDGKNWTQSWALVCEDVEYSGNATMVYLDKYGYCHKCREHREHQ